MSLMIEEKNMKHMTTLSEIVSDVVTGIHLDINEGQEAHIESDLEDMLEVMEDLKFNPFITATNSWNERQIILSHILDSRLIPEVRDPLMQRAEYALSKAGV